LPEAPLALAECVVYAFLGGDVPDHQAYRFPPVKQDPPRGETHPDGLPVLAACAEHMLCFRVGALQDRLCGCCGIVEGLFEEQLKALPQ